jgi:hypothetical protein
MLPLFSDLPGVDSFVIIEYDEKDASEVREDGGQDPDSSGNG